jgi:hypothetical protein
MLECILAPLAAVGVFFRSRTDTGIEVLALRQQVAMLKRKRPRPCGSSKLGPISESGAWSASGRFISGYDVR